MASKKSEKAPLTRCSGTMNESQYLAWIRSCLRSKSLKWKPRTDCILAARRPYKGPNKQQKYEVLCAMCKGWFKLKEIAVDHYPVEAGSIKSVEDIGPFAERLFCETDNLRCLCHECHRKWTLASSKGITIEQAALEILVNDTLKDKKKTIALLKENEYNNCSNDEKRKAALMEIFRSGNAQ